MLAINPLYMIGYALGSRLSVIGLILVSTIVFPVLLLALVEIPRHSSITTATVLLEAFALLAGGLGGALRRNLRDGFEIYYLSTTSGRLSAFSLFCSSTYLHILALATWP